MSSQDMPCAVRAYLAAVQAYGAFHERQSHPEPALDHFIRVIGRAVAQATLSQGLPELP
jgi:hypothetical protein